MAEWMLLVWFAPREFGTDDRDDGRQGIRQIVDCIEQHGNGIRCDADGRLEGRKQDVDDDADDTRAHDDASAHRHLFFDWYSCMILCHVVAPFLARHARQSESQEILS